MSGIQTIKKFVFRSFNFTEKTIKKEFIKMPYRETKVYFDGSHYIAIPPENFPKSKRKRRKQKPKKKTAETPLTTPKEKFETAYSESKNLPKRKRKAFLTEQLKDTFKSEEETTAFIESNIERKKINAMKRRTRLMRKVYLQQWNYFVTLTYDNELHTEDTFKKKLQNTLKHLVYRNKWKYIGVWERSPEKQRLHFHGIFSIPQMIGELKNVYFAERIPETSNIRLERVAL